MPEDRTLRVEPGRWRLGLIAQLQEFAADLEALAAPTPSDSLDRLLLAIVIHIDERLSSIDAVLTLILEGDRALSQQFTDLEQHLAGVRQAVVDAMARIQQIIANASGLTPDESTQLANELDGVRDSVAALAPDAVPAPPADQPPADQPPADQPPADQPPVQ